MKEAGDVKDSIPKDATRKENVKILYMPRMDDNPLTHIDGLEFRFVETLHEVT